MWVITHIHSGKKIYFLPGREYTIGRVGSDVVLTDDTSISRSHACLQVSRESIQLEDKGSKYGTYHNEHIETKQKLTKNKPIDIKEGDRILFGALKNEWLVAKNNINSLVSSLNAKDMIEVKKYLDLMGGNIISTWESKCTHLTMSELSITIKVLHALIEKIPIVSCEFWKDYLKSVHEKQDFPNPCQYLPKRSKQLSSAIQDKHLVFNESRKTLFSGKTFVFMTKKHFDMYSPIIMKAGGQCKDLNKNVSKAFLVKKNTVVVQYVASTQSQGSQTINTISEYLHSKSLRTVPEYEIGLAIVCCTTEKYCNPAYSTISNILPDSAGTPNIGTMLAENTGSQRSEIYSAELSDLSIPESSNYLKPKTGPNKTAVRSEVYDSEIITIESQNSMDCLSIIPDSDLDKNSNAEVDEHSGLKSVHGVQNINFSDDEFSENLVMSSDMASSDVVKSKKRPITPIENNTVASKKPRISTPPREQSKEEYNHVEKSAEPRPPVPATKRNATQTKQVLPGFLQKSQVINTQPEALQKSQQAANRSSQAPVKRGRIALINDNDSNDDDDDIFNFGTAQKKSRTSEVGGRLSDEEELFAFGRNKSRHEVDHALVHDAGNSETSLSKSQPIVARNKFTSNVNNVSRRIKISPLKPSPDGWLSALSILKIKDESDDVKKEEDCSTDDLKRREWIDSLKNGFEVRVRKMNLVSRTSTSSVVDREQSETSLNTTRKNFKAFVKKHNYKTQTKIIPTFKSVVAAT